MRSRADRVVGAILATLFPVATYPASGLRRPSRNAKSCRKKAVCGKRGRMVRERENGETRGFAHAICDAIVVGQ